MTDKLDIRTIDVGLSSTIVQLFKLPQQMIDYLWERIDIAKKNPTYMNKNLAGNISHMYKLKDPQNLVVQNLNNILFNPIDNPKMFEFIQKEVQTFWGKTGYNGMLTPQLDDIWVNFQKKAEFQPIHNHSCMFSFVIWMDIPYHSKDESKSDHKGDFSFLTASGTSREVKPTNIEMSPEMNGYCCFFPSDLCHQVYPFYTSDKDRISISGNIHYHPKESNPPPVYQFPFHMSGT
jgi:hypothetical protein